MRAKTLVTSLVHSVTFLLVCAIGLFSVQLHAQTHITVINPSFEKPDSGKVTGWDGKSKNPNRGKLIDIPGWRTDAKDSSDFDSGLELSGTDISDGKYRAFMMGTDTSMYQNLGKRVDVGDVITLTVLAKENWPAGVGTLQMEIFYLNGDTARVPIVIENKALTSNWADYSISFNASSHPEAVGWKIGILFDNTTPPNAQSASGGWLNFDNVRLTNGNPTIIEVPNYSFELPDSSKVKGWDGVCADPTWTHLVDIPGWTCDEPPNDSGVELGWAPTDGVYTGFMEALDSAVYNITDYTIATDDVIRLRVDGRITWAATLLRIALVYLDETTGNPVTIVSADEQLTGSYNEYSILFAAKNYPQAVGHKLGVLLDNVSPNGQSWVGFDNVRVNNVKDQFYARESFAYPVGTSIDTLMGTSTNGWGGSWYKIVANQANALVVADTGLPYSDLSYTVPNVGGHLESVPDSSGKEQRYGRQLDKTWPNVAGRQYWISFIMDVKNATDNSTWLGVKYYDGASSELGMLGKGHGLDKYTCGSGWHGSPGPEVSQVTWDAGPVWLVGKTVMQGATSTVADTTYMWINPDPAGAVPDISTADAIALTNMKNGFNTIRIEFGGNVGTTGLSVSYDELRLGTSWQDVSSSFSPATSVPAQIQNVPVQFTLSQNYPNPFNPSTNISYTLKTRGMVHLSVYDILGREVAALVNENQNAGPHKVTFSGTGLTSGVYFYRLLTADGVNTKKMVLLK